MNNKSLLLLVLSCLVGQSIVSMQHNAAQKRKRGCISFTIVPKEFLQLQKLAPHPDTIVTQLEVGPNFTEKLEEHMNKRKYAEIQHTFRGERALLRAATEARNAQRTSEEAARNTPLIIRRKPQTSSSEPTAPCTPLVAPARSQSATWSLVGDPDFSGGLTQFSRSSVESVFNRF